MILQNGNQKYVCVGEGGRKEEGEEGEAYGYGQRGHRVQVHVISGVARAKQLEHAHPTPLGQTRARAFSHEFVKPISLVFLLCTHTGMYSQK